MTWLHWALLPACYLLGSISFAWLAARLKGVDLRRHGSGNLGATNAGRVLGKQWFVVVFFGDLGKGLLAVLAMRFLPTWLGFADTAGSLPWVLAAVAVVLGHVFTLFHGLKGGKAVATSLGVLIALVPWVAAIAFAAWLLCWLTFRFLLGASASLAVSPASILAAVAAPLAGGLWPGAWSVERLPVTILLIVLGAVILIRHRSNAREVGDFLRRGRQAPLASPSDDGDH